MGDHLGSLLAPLAEALRGTVVDGELVALSSCDGRAVQDFGAVCRATLHADAVAASKLHLVAFDLLELARDDVRSLPWVKRTELLREVFPASERLRVVQTQPTSRAAHDQLVALGFEGSVLKRPGSTYRPGRQTTWRKYKASHRAGATLRAVRPGRDGHTYAVCELDGRRVTAFGSPRLAALIGHRVELTFPPTIFAPFGPTERTQSSAGIPTKVSNPPPPSAPNLMSESDGQSHARAAGLWARGSQKLGKGDRRAPARLIRHNRGCPVWFGMRGAYAPIVEAPRRWSC